MGELDCLPKPIVVLSWKKGIEDSLQLSKKLRKKTTYRDKSRIGFLFGGVSYCFASVNWKAMVFGSPTPNGIRLATCRTMKRSWKP